MLEPTLEQIDLMLTLLERERDRKQPEATPVIDDLVEKLEIEKGRKHEEEE